MSQQDKEEFYIGYLDQAPEGVGRFVKLRVGLMLLLAVLVAGLLTAAQSPFAIAFFDFGAPKAYEGIVRLVPHPVLEVERPGVVAAGEAKTSRYLLVGFGKAGADAEIDGLVDQRVRLEGTPIYRDGQTMLEIVPGSVAAADIVSNTTGSNLVAPPAESGVSLGDYTFEGEIVDSKCYLGVMKPGETKPHRACATLCIRGGIPPLLLVRGDDPPAAQLLLVGQGGEAINDAVLDYVAEPVSIRGELVRMGDLYLLRADPSTIRRL